MRAFALLSSDAYMPYTRVCIDSIQRHHPGEPIHLLYFGNDEHDPLLIPGVTVHRPGDILGPHQQPVTHGDADYIAAHRPDFLRMLLGDHDRVLLLGSDCVLYSQVGWLFDQLDSFHPAILTPHFLAPFPDDGKHPSYEDLLYTGHMNVDVVGLLAIPEIKEFLKWMGRMLHTHCVRDKARHHFSDQTWWHFLFDFVPGTQVCHNPGYNVGYWNVMQRDFKLVAGPWPGLRPYVGNKPLAIFQFSGISMDDPGQMSTHQNRYRAEGELLSLFQDYVAEVRKYA